MISRIKVFLSILALICLTPVTAKADFIFAMDMDLSVSGIQSSRSVAAGTVFEAALVLRLTEGSELYGFSLGTSFDTSVMQVQTWDVSGRPTGFQNQKSVVANNVLGTVRTFDALSVNSPLSAPETRLATFSIVAVSPSTSLSGTFVPEFQDVTTDGVTDGNFANASLGVAEGDGGVFFQSGTLNVAAVPEPTSILLVSAAFACGAGCYRARKRRERKRLE